MFMLKKSPCIVSAKVWIDNTYTYWTPNQFHKQILNYEEEEEEKNMRKCYWLWLLAILELDNLFSQL